MATSSESINAITYSRAIARQLGLQERDIWRLLTGTRLTVDRFIFDDAPISNTDQQQIFLNTLSLSGDPAFGLRLGQMLTPPAHGAMGFLVNCSPTLLTALEDFAKYLPTRVGFSRLEILLSGEQIECRMQVLYKEEMLYRLISEAFAISLVLLLENIIGSPLTDAELHFTFPPPHYHERYAEQIHCPIRFNAPQNRLLLPSDIKNVANAASDFHTYQLYKQQCQKQLSELDLERSSTSERVKKILLLSPPDRHLTEDDIADAMFISKRTLARRLRDEGASFRQIREEVIVSLAKGYLSDTELPIDRIATLLAYHDSSSFRRAFKRAVGIAPLAYRIGAQPRHRNIA